MKKWLGVACIAMCGLVGCDKKADLVCTPGASQSCACADGRKGAQTCKADGSGLGTCVCAAVAEAAAEPTPPPAAAEPVAPSAPAAEGGAQPRVAFTTTLGPLDHYSGRGVELTSAAAIIRQDRFRVHSGRPDDGDEKDSIYSDEQQRVQLEQLLQAAIPSEMAQTITDHNAKVQVRVFDNRAEVVVLETGSDEVACVVSPGKIAGIAWNAGTQAGSLPPRMAKRGWRTEASGETTVLISPDGHRVAEISESGTQLLDGTCMTTHGVRIGATLRDARKDTDFDARACVCEPSQENVAVVVSKTDNSNGGALYLHATCSQPLRCPGEGELPPCEGGWGRGDCVIDKMDLHPPPGA